MLPVAVVQPQCQFLVAQAATTPAPWDELGAALSSHRIDVMPAANAADAVRTGFEAAAGGARVLVATGGPGLGACGEILGRAQLAEVPLVVVHCQYLQYPDILNEPVAGDFDVILARHLSALGAPLPVLVATDSASCRDLVLRAFKIAERLQMPVILLTSLDVAQAEDAASRGSGPIPLSSVAQAFRPCSHRRDGGAIGLWDWLLSVPPERPTQESEVPPGQGRGLLSKPRLLEAKLDRLRDQVVHNRELLEIVAADPDPDAQTLLLSYGLADQAAREAVKLVRAAGARVSHLTIHSLWPMPEQALRRAVTPFVNRILVPELNPGLYAGELARVIKNVKIESLPRYDGQPIEAEAIARRITHWPCG